MRFGRNASTAAPGLGLWITPQGLAMMQLSPTGALADVQQDGYWQPFSDGDGQSQWLTGFDSQLLRQALERNGFQARKVAMAIPQAHLHSFQFEFDDRLNPRQLKAVVREQLQAVLPWPLADAVWDFQVTQAATATTAGLRSNRPAWLDQALQAQTVNKVDVIAIPKAWAQACEDGCRAAGLQLRRLEPAWQAVQRWQAFIQQQSTAVLHEKTAAYGTTWGEEEQAVVGGLALGVLMP